MTIDLIPEEPPRRTRQAGALVDVAGLAAKAKSNPGTWFKYPREYQGYPNDMKRRFTEQGLKTTVASKRNPDGVITGYVLYLQFDPNDESPTG